MKVIVLGAGVTGVAAGWNLSKAEHEVTVLERNAGAARETSFGNGGQISVSHAEPWANPSAPLKLLKWLGRVDAPLLECMPRRSTHNMVQLLTCTASRPGWQSADAQLRIRPGDSRYRRWPPPRRRLRVLLNATPTHIIHQRAGRHRQQVPNWSLLRRCKPYQGA